MKGQALPGRNSGIRAEARQTGAAGGSESGGAKGIPERGRRAGSDAPAAPKTREEVEQAAAAGEEEYSDGEIEAEEEEEEGQRQCILCGNVPSSIICLVCNHCVDIPCAAQLIIGEGDLQKLDLGSITCPECSQTTSLSQEVQQTILEYLQSEELQFEGQGETEQYEEEQGQYQEENTQQVGSEDAQLEEQEQHEIKQSELEAQDEQSQEEAQFNQHKFSKVSPSNQKNGQRSGQSKSAKHSNKQSGLDTIKASSTKRDVKIQPKASSSSGLQYKKNTMNQSSSDSTHPAQSNTQSELSLHFACLDHPNEEYAFYSTVERKLYCASCLIAVSGPGGHKPVQPNSLKPLKRSLGVISQHMQELLSSVEVSLALLVTRQRDFQIRSDNLSAQITSRRKQLDSVFQEVIDRASFLRNQVEDLLTSAADKVLDDTRNQAEDFEEKISYLQAVLNEIQTFQDEENEQGLFEFYLSNQEKIREFVEAEDEERAATRIRNLHETAFYKHQQYLEQEAATWKENLLSIIKESFRVGWEQHKSGSGDTNGVTSNSGKSNNKGRVDISKYVIEANPKLARRDSKSGQLAKAYTESIPRQRSSELKSLQGYLDENLSSWQGLGQTGNRQTSKVEAEERGSGDAEVVTKGILRGLGRTPDRLEVNQRYSQLAAQITKPSVVEPSSLKPGYLTSKLSLAKATLSNGSVSAHHLSGGSPSFGGDPRRDKSGTSPLMHLLGQQASEQERLQQKLEQFSLPKESRLYRPTSAVVATEPPESRLPLGNTIESLREFRSKMREHYAFEQLRGHHSLAKY